MDFPPPVPQTASPAASPLLLQSSLPSRPRYRPHSDPPLCGGHNASYQSITVASLLPGGKNGGPAPATDERASTAGARDAADRAEPGLMEMQSTCTLVHVRMTLNVESDLLREAGRLTGMTQKTTLVRMGLQAVIAQESGNRLAALARSEPRLRPARRRRALWAALRLSASHASPHCTAAAVRRRERRGPGPGRD